MTLATWRDLSLILLILEAMLFVLPVLILMYFAVRWMPVIPEKLQPILKQGREYVLRAERETKRATKIIVMIPITTACVIAQAKRTTEKLIPDALYHNIIENIPKQGDAAT